MLFSNFHYNRIMFTLTWSNIKGALVSGAIMGALAIGLYVIGLGDVFAIQWKPLINAGILSALTTIVSLVKSFLTTDRGNFVGAIEVK